MLGLAFQDAQHTIVYGVWNPEDPKHATLHYAGFYIVTVDQAVQASEIILLAVPWNLVHGLLSTHDWDSKIIIDCTNPIKSDFSGVKVEHGLSGAERVRRLAPISASKINQTNPQCCCTLVGVSKGYTFMV